MAKVIVDPPDLRTQLETLLHVVFLEEAGWDFDDLIDLRAGTPPQERLSDHGNWKDGAFNPPT
jgi:hypothetical protein